LCRAATSKIAAARSAAGRSGWRASGARSPGASGPRAWAGCPRPRVRRRTARSVRGVNARHPSAASASTSCRSASTAPSRPGASAVSSTVAAGSRTSTRRPLQGHLPQKGPQGARPPVSTGQPVGEVPLSLRWHPRPDVVRRQEAGGVAGEGLSQSKGRHVQPNDLHRTDVAVDEPSGLNPRFRDLGCQRHPRRPGSRRPSGIHSAAAPPAACPGPPGSAPALRPIRA